MSLQTAMASLLSSCPSFLKPATSSMFTRRDPCLWKTGICGLNMSVYTVTVSALGIIKSKNAVKFSHKYVRCGFIQGGKVALLVGNRSLCCLWDTQTYVTFEHFEAMVQRRVVPPPSPHGVVNPPRCGWGWAGRGSGFRVLGFGVWV